MNPDRLFDGLREDVRKNAPEDMDITDIEFEASVIAIYTKDYEKYSENNDVAKSLAQALRRRVDIRPDHSMLEDVNEVDEKIRSMIPSSAELFDINFIPETGEAIIEAINPNEVVGKEGKLLGDLKKESGWNVKVIRAPPIPSKTVSDVRGYLRHEQDERRAMLKSVARRLARPTLNGEQWVRMTTMGGFRQVGRSATLLMTRDSKILIDCGLDPGSDATPYFAIPEAQPLSDLDAVVITHAHLDHCGTLPALFKYGYEGPVYCTPPTRDLMALLQLDNIKLGFGEAKKILYEAQHVRKEILHTITLKYNETTDITPDVRLTFHNAGHILGSAIAHFHIGDGLHNVAFTGDTKYEKTWLFNPANNRFPRLETLVIESTYGGHNDFQPSRVDASDEMRELLTEALAHNGKVLIPVFAVEGRRRFARHRRAHPYRKAPQRPRLSGRNDLGSNGHPYGISRVSQQSAEVSDLPAEREPLPFVDLPPCGDVCDERGDMPFARSLHRPRYKRYDVRRSGHGVLQGMVR